MRKTLNINLGGLAFIIDENAFDLLHNYLEALKRKFNNEAERTEIMNDIESRIAEMLSQRLQNRKEIIGLDDVEFVTNAMGKPEDIAGEEAGETTQSAGSTSASSSQTAQVKKRLFRDPDDAKVGGVISGLCHYFGISDPVWMRIAALILIFFTSGTIIFVYFLLLVIIPKAQTAAEKLQMKGEPVNINTIEKEIKDAASRAGESMHRFVKEQNIFERLWDATLSAFKAVLKLLAIIDIFISMIFLMTLAVCFFAFSMVGTTTYNEASHLLVDSGPALRLFSIGLLLFLATPLIAFTYLGLKALLGQRSRVRWLKWVLFAGWFAGLVLLGISSLKIYSNFVVTGVQKTESVIVQPGAGRTLYVQLTDTTGRRVSKYHNDFTNSRFEVNAMGEVIINGTDLRDINLISLGKPTLQLMASENDSFYVQEITSSQGRNNADARKNAQMVIYAFKQTDTLLGLPLNYYISKTGKWRGQDMTIRIAIPRGKKIMFDDNIDLWQISVKGDANFDDTYFANTVWTVEDGKVKCLEGENHKNDGSKIEKPTPPRKPEPPAANTNSTSHTQGKHHNDDNNDDQDF